MTNVPTLAERSGDFSESLLNAPFNPFSGQPFSGRRIPDFFIHPVGQAIANLYPEPNRATPFANYVSSPTLTDEIDHFDVRIDHNFAQGLAVDDSIQPSTIGAFSSRLLLRSVCRDTAPMCPARGQNLVIGFTQPLGGKHHS